MTSSESSSNDNSTDWENKYHCLLCKQLLGVDPESPHVWRQVTGWVGGPKRDHMRLRESTGQLAHERCVQLMSAGQAPDQDSLFDSGIDTMAPDDYLGTELPNVFLNDNCL